MMGDSCEGGAASISGSGVAPVAGETAWGTIEGAVAGLSEGPPRVAPPPGVGPLAGAEPELACAGAAGVADAAGAADGEALGCGAGAGNCWARALPAKRPAQSKNRAGVG